MNLWSTDHRNDRNEMKRIIDTIQSDADLYLLASLVMRATGINNSVSGLFNILNSEGLLNIVKVYGGKTVHVPTLDELLESLRFIKLLYCYDFQGVSFSKAMEYAGFKQNQRDELLQRRSVVLERLQAAYNNNKKE